MNTPPRRPVPSVRASRRILGVTGLTTALLIAGALPAAAVPEGWETPPPVSGLQFLLVLLVLPAAAFGVIALLSYLSASRTPQYSTEVELHQGGQAWLGGPGRGVDAVGRDGADEAGSTTGGAGARW